MTVIKDAAQPLLSVRDLNVSYSTAGGDVSAVQGVNLEVHPGQMTAIVGESGSGKTTSAMAAIGLLPSNATIDAGTITFDGRDITSLRRREWRELRGRRIGLIPQDPNNSLNPVQTIGASVEEGLRIHKVGTAAERKAKALELLERVGIDDPARRYHQYPHELSGGMKQRVLIAAAVALEPDLIIADEPTSALDVTVQKIILDLLDDMRAELGMGILFITHDLAVAGDRADRVVVMESGQLREEGLAATVLTNPRHDYTKRLLADAPSLTVADARTATTGAVAKAGATAERASSVPHVAATARDAGEPLVRVEGLTQRFGDFTAVDDISFTVAKGSTHAIVGESGSGKTTTGRSIAMFNTPTSGSITVGGRDIVGLRGKALREERNNIQLVYQNPYGSLDPKQTIGQTVAEPLRNLKGERASAAKEKAKEFLDLVALNPDYYDRRPRELSGGQRQRVAIARAMIVEPELVILDEAVSALDVTVQAQILRLLARLQEELGLTYIFISHDLAVVNQISDTVSVLSKGQQVECGPTAEVFSNPQSPFTRKLIEAIPGSRYRAGDLNLGL
ncbi:ABC transporter ATP-binding protein [Corynebacterium sp. HMSC035E02]|uniref:dipeptide ABC transporter ATP-binding protein n=1 Tax=unclassified Corynebacterium TaxID=2624378 RepID=UPI0008A4147F|nr:MULTISPECIES: ABC transporter ATP-binding protein [unclassified Corynebacterium]OFN79379.1 ABC transporter ATP-binding protein [Corynebacterium sp. HMSC070E08]OFQ57747.1 ABC transporter ATP-binding protein [Corynebacterium sp. HMSC074H12]OHO51342.1 ABC transporter ATP-binding protein [Corynebacterium sp. HMSC035E02]